MILCIHFRMISILRNFVFNTQNQEIRKRIIRLNDYEQHYIYIQVCVCVCVCVCVREREE